MSKSTWKKAIIAVSAVIVVLILMFARSYQVNRNNPRHDLGFREYYPAKPVAGFIIDINSLQVVRDDAAVLLYSMTADKNKITVSQQLDSKGDAYSSFIVPDQNYQFINGSFGQIAISSINVTVPGSLALQDEPRTIAAARNKSTTVIMHAEKSVSIDDWKAIYDGLKPNCVIQVFGVCK